MRGACALMLMSNRFTHRGGTSWSMCISTSCSTVIGTNAAKMGAKLSAALGIAGCGSEESRSAPARTLAPVLRLADYPSSLAGGLPRHSNDNQLLVF